MDEDAKPGTGRWPRPAPAPAPAPAARANGDDRNRQPRGTRRRQQILDAAVELLAAKGYRATGVTGLAERVGLTAPGVLYCDRRHAPSRSVFVADGTRLPTHTPTA
jgi:hypothetical protein